MNKKETSILIKSPISKIVYKDMNFDKNYCPLCGGIVVVENKDVDSFGFCVECSWQCGPFVYSQECFWKKSVLEEGK